MEQNSAYEIYFEAENLVGLKTIIKDNGENFLFTTNYDAEYAAETLLPFSLPAGSIYQDPVNITQNEPTDIYLRTFDNSRVTNLFKFNNDNFEIVDSLQDRIIRDFGDFNNNGLKDLLTSWVRNGYVLEQQNSNSSSFDEKYVDETGNFWPVMAEDIDGDGITEVVVINSDTSVNVWKVQNDLTLYDPITLRNFTERWIGDNILDSPNGVLADVNADGIKELWFVDVDGDIFSYNILGQIIISREVSSIQNFWVQLPILLLEITMEIIKMILLFCFTQLVQLILRLSTVCLNYNLTWQSIKYSL